MINAIKGLFNWEKTDFSELVKNGAIILDVKSEGEFKSGHIKGAMNIPVTSLANNLKKLKDKSKPVITCCASGIRSASAKMILKNNGFTQVYNGGSWISLNNKILLK